MARERKRRRQRRQRRDTTPGADAYSEVEPGLDRGGEQPVAAPPRNGGEPHAGNSSAPIHSETDPVDDPTADPALSAAAEPDFDEPVRPAVRPSDYDDEQDESLESEAVAGVRAQRAPARPAKGNRVTGFLRASWAELQRVQWPNRQQVFQATAVVLGFVVIAGAYLAGADYVAGKIVDAIL